MTLFDSMGAKISTAGKWEMFKARLFGRKIETRDMTIYQWRGRFYVCRCDPK